MRKSVQLNPNAVLNTARLYIRPLVIADTAAMFALRSNVEIMTYIPRTLPKNLEDAQVHLQSVIDGNNNGDVQNWGICLRDLDYVIGTIGFYRIKKDHYRGEVGYLLHKNYHRQGIMDEALKAVIQYGFQEINFHTIEAVIDPRNIASRRLLEKNNFQLEGSFKENEYWQGEFLNMDVYTLWE